MAGEKNNGLLIYPVPEGTPHGTACFSVKANGQLVGVYSDTNGWDKPVNWAYFHISDGTKVQVEVEPDFDFDSYKILPGPLGVKGEQKGRKITFDVSRPGQNFTLVFNDNYMGAALHIFVSAIDPHQPETGSDTLIYFGPGLHNLYETHHDGLLKVSGRGKTVYIAPGAVVCGMILFTDANDSRILGGGILMMGGYEGNPMFGVALTINASINFTLGEIIVNSRAVPLDGPERTLRGTWSTKVDCCRNLTVDGYRVVSTVFASTDSLSICSSSNVKIKNCFLRSCDDTISLKGLGNPIDNTYWGPIENISMSDCILWSDANNAMVVGEESRAKYYKNISFKNIDVIFSYDSREPHHLNLDERSVMSIVGLDGTYFSDISWEDIRVNNCQRLICMTFVDDFWYGDLPGHQEHEGGIKDVAFLNISSVSSEKNIHASPISNEILLNGYGAVKYPANPKKYIENITFENVMIDGVKLTASYGRLRKNSYVRDLVFK
jgi:hypothetical protein